MLVSFWEGTTGTAVFFALAPVCFPGWLIGWFVCLFVGWLATSLASLGPRAAIGGSCDLLGAG